MTNILRFGLIIHKPPNLQANGTVPNCLNEEVSLIIHLFYYSTLFLNGQEIDIFFITSLNTISLNVCCSFVVDN